MKAIRLSENCAELKTMNLALLIPQVSVGDVGLGDEIEIYTNRRLEYTDSILGVPYSCYSFDGTPILAYTDENDRVESIHCETVCLWRGMNLIGMNIAKFEELAGQSHNGEIDHIQLTEQLQDVYEYDDLGLQIWGFNGTIVTIIACDYRE